MNLKIIRGVRTLIPIKAGWRDAGDDVISQRGSVFESRRDVADVSACREGMREEGERECVCVCVREREKKRE